MEITTTNQKGVGIDGLEGGIKMKKKGRGYHGHSREHGLHRKGIATKTARSSMYSMGKKMIPNYIYHGTGEGSFRRIRLEGFTNDKNYFSELQEYAQSYADRKGTGERILRIKATDDMYEDDSNIGGDYIIPRKIKPKDIEVLVNGRWINIQDYHDESRNISPIQNSQEIK